MPRFRLFLETITCNAITDSMLEGNEDEIYLSIWYQAKDTTIVKEKIPLGSYKPGTFAAFERFLVDEEFKDLEFLGFDFYDSDVFSSDDLLGGFILNSTNEIILGPCTKAIFDHALSSTTFTLTGNGSNYVINMKVMAI